MSISAEVPDRSPSRVLAQATATLRALSETLWSARSDGELVESIEQVQLLVAAVAAVEIGAVAEAHARGVAQDTLHYGSTADWLTHAGGLRRGEGKQRVVRATALTGPLTRTHAALVEGKVSPAQVDVIVAAVADLPPQEWTTRRGEKLMLRHARSLDATELIRAGRHLVEVVDPDATDRKLEAMLEREERAAHLDRTLSVTADRAGGVRIKGHGSAEDGALIKAALLPLTCPAPAVEAATHPPAGQENLDPRDYGARLWDALVTTAQRSLDARVQPGAHGTPARLLVTVDHRALAAELSSRGVGITSDGTELPPGVLRRLACDAEIIPAVLGTRGEFLDVGRSRRLVTPAIWTALVVRDQHCTFPACTRPPAMCHAHHLDHWADGGETKLDNLALLCGHHHRTVHHTPWNIRLQPDDRRPEFRAPPRAGVTAEWIRQRPRHE